jgi:hypothetical protein
MFSRKFVEKNIIPLRSKILLKKQGVFIKETSWEIYKERKIEELYEERRQIQQRLMKTERGIYVADLFDRGNELLDEIQQIKDLGIFYPDKFIRCQNPSCSFGLCCSEDGFECFLCGELSCPQCKKCIKDLWNMSQHNCDLSDKSSVEMIKSMAKPCPWCEVPIEKIDGCGQMWCSQCHTTFDWNTGRIERQHYHNPHFYSYQQKLYGDNMPTLPYANRYIPEKIMVECSWRVYCEDDPFVLDALRSERELLEEYEMFELNTLAHEFDVWDVPLARKRYVLGNMTKKTFEKVLIRREKSHHKGIAHRRVMENMLKSCGKIMRDVGYGRKCPTDGINEIYREYENADEQLEEIHRLLPCGKKYDWQNT